MISDREMGPLEAANPDFGRRGRWIRRGAAIVVYADPELTRYDRESSELAGPRRFAAAPRVLSYSEVIDPRVSVPAQHSLVRLSKAPATSAAAVGMVAEIKAGRLAGISCVNWQKAAQRALRHGRSWWTVIPPGNDSLLLLDPDQPSAGPPLIVFRRELDPACGRLERERPFPASPARLDAALLAAWASYGRWRKGQDAVPIPPTIQQCLNKILNLRLPLTGVLDARTASALRQFRGRHGIAELEVGGGAGLDDRTRRAIETVCDLPASRCQTHFADAGPDLVKHSWLPFPDYRFDTIAFGGLPLLTERGPGFQRLAAGLLPAVKPHGQSGPGKLLFAKTDSKRIPGLWAVFVPDGLRVDEPVPVHIFFHPVPRRDMLETDYPFAGNWRAHFDNYLVNKGKKLLQQHAASGKKCIFLFPAGRPKGIYGELANARTLRQWLLDLLCWLQGHLGQSSAKPAIWRCAVSAFSSGGPFALYPILASSLKGEFPELMEAYCLDTAQLDSHVPLLTQWWAKGNRTVRIYRDFGQVPAMPAMFGRKPVRADTGALEFQAKNATLLFTPERFWDTVFTEDGCTRQAVATNFGATSAHCRAYNYWGTGLHQLMPCVFLEHALRNSMFPDV